MNREALYNSFLKKIKRKVRNPLLVTVGGVRMYGFFDMDTDWELHCFFQLPASELFSFNPPEQTFFYQENDKLNSNLKIHCTEIQKVFTEIMYGDYKYLESLYSVEKLLKSDYIKDLKRTATKLLTRRLFQNYVLDIQQGVQDFEETGDCEKLLLSFIRAMSAYMLAETKKCFMNVRELNKRYKYPFVYDMLRYRSLGDHAIDTTQIRNETLQLVENIVARIPDFPEEIDSKRYNDVEKHLIRMRLSYLIDPKRKLL